jgi:hypothetical protein
MQFYMVQHDLHQNLDELLFKHCTMFMENIVGIFIV